MSPIRMGPAAYVEASQRNAALVARTVDIKMLVHMRAGAGARSQRHFSIIATTLPFGKVQACDKKQPPPEK